MQRNTEISSGRKAAYYGGMALIASGLILIVSAILNSMDTGPSPSVYDPNFGAQVEARMKKMHENGQSTVARWITAMVLCGIGGFLMNAGAHGKAGSGLLLDPEQARKDMEPWNRMKGGMLNDALSEVDILQPRQPAQEQTPEEPDIKIRCRSCRAVNEEEAKFCSQCGQPV